MLWNRVRERQSCLCVLWCSGGEKVACSPCFIYLIESISVVPSILSVYCCFYKTSVSFPLPDHSVYSAICSAVLPVVTLHYFEPQSRRIIQRIVYISHVSRDAN